MHVGSGLGYEISMLMYLLNFTYVQQIHRLFSCSYEAILGIISLYYFSKITLEYDFNLKMVIFLQSVSFIIRNTSPIGWVPILLLKAYSLDFALLIKHYIIGFFYIFLPLFIISTLLDSWYYGVLTVVPWNFIKVNVFEGLSQTFGSDPMMKYVCQEIPARVNIFLPCLVFGAIHHWQVCRNRQQYAYLIIYSISIIGFLSLISHKEPKFLLPVFPVFFIVIGQYLQDKWSKTHIKSV